MRSSRSSARRFAHEDDPARAVLAALAVRDAIAELNADDPSLELHVRVAVTTGEALVRLDARPEQGEGIAAGDVVNTASRLQSAAPVDGILVDDATRRATEHRHRVSRGRPGPGEGQVGAGARRGRPSRRIARLGVDIAFRGGASLVGRSAELATLLRCARARRSATAPRSSSRSSASPESARADSSGSSSRRCRRDPSVTRHLAAGSLAAVRRRRRLLGARRDDEGPGRHPRERRRAGGRSQAPRGGRCGDPRRGARPGWVEGHLRPLAGLERGQRRRAPTAASEAFAAWRRFFEALAERRPLVLVFEDLHWADDGLLDFVDHLVGLVERRAAPDRLHRTARAPRPAARLGRRQAERDHDLARAALGRRRPRSSSRPCSTNGGPRRGAPQQSF